MGITCSAGRNCACGLFCLTVSAARREGRLALTFETVVLTRARAQATCLAASAFLRAVCSVLSSAATLALASSRCPVTPSTSEHRTTGEGHISQRVLEHASTRGATRRCCACLGTLSWPTPAALWWHAVRTHSGQQHRRHAPAGTICAVTAWKRARRRGGAPR